MKKPRTPKEVLESLEQLKEKLSPDLQRKVGNVFFGSDNQIAKLQGAKPPEEPNTSWEDDLYYRLTRWLDTSDTTVAKYLKKNKQILDLLAKEFPQLLMPPIGQMAYRGTGIKIDSLEQAFKKKKFEVIKVAGREVFHFKNLGYTPARDAQSWTTNPRVALKFEADQYDGKIGVIYATKIDKNFMFNPKLMNIMFQGKEDEVVRIAGKGTFEAYVSTKVALNNWNLEPEENFIHRIPSAKPFFTKMVEDYNKDVAAENKYSDDKLPRAGSVTAIMQHDFNGDTPTGFDVKREYAKCVKNYINSKKTD